MGGIRKGTNELNVFLFPLRLGFSSGDESDGSFFLSPSAVGPLPHRTDSFYALGGLAEATMVSESRKETRRTEEEVERRVEFGLKLRG